MERSSATASSSATTSPSKVEEEVDESSPIKHIVVQPEFQEKSEYSFGTSTAPREYEDGEEIDSEDEEPEEKPECKVILSKTGLRVVEGGACDFYTVRLSSRPNADVMIQIDDPSCQVRCSPKVVRFAFEATTPEENGYWANEQKVRVMAIDDDTVEETCETARLVHTLLSADPRFSTVGKDIEASIDIDIVDNDGGFIYTFGEIHGTRDMIPVIRSLRQEANNLGRQEKDNGVTPKTDASTVQDEGIRTIGCGDNHLAVALADGRLYTVGLGSNGQLGLGDFKNRPSFSAWRSIDRDGVLRSKITQVSCGQGHTAMVTDDGRLLMAGSNQQGQLGLCDGPNAGCSECLSSLHSDSPDAVFPGKVKSSRVTKGLRRNTRIANPSALETSTVCAVPRLVESLTHLFVERVACGLNHTVVLASTGSSNTDRGVVRCRIFGWGDSTSGALGSGLQCFQHHPVEITELTHLDPFQVTCGARHTAVLCGPGHLYTASWGLNGCFGRRVREDNPTLNHFERITVPGRKEQPLFVDIASGHSHLGALADDLNVYVCGQNESGQLGLGDKVYRSHLTKVGFLEGLGTASISFGMFHSCCSTVDGELYVWGGNDHGQLGLGGHVIQRSLPVLQSAITEDVKQVQAGKAFTAVILGKPCLNREPELRKEREKKYQERKSVFLARKKQLDREKQAKFLENQRKNNTNVRDQRRRKKTKNSRRQIDPEKIRELARRLPYETVTKFKPRIIKKPTRARLRAAAKNRGRKIVVASTTTEGTSDEKPAEPVSPSTFCPELNSFDRAAIKYQTEREPEKTTKKKKKKTTKTKADSGEEGRILSDEILREAEECEAKIGISAEKLIEIMTEEQEQQNRKKKKKKKSSPKRKKKTRSTEALKEFRLEPEMEAEIALQKKKDAELKKKRASTTNTGVVFI